MAVKKTIRTKILMANHSRGRMPGVLARLRGLGHKVFRTGNIIDTITSMAKKEPDLVLLKPSSEPVPPFEWESMKAHIPPSTQVILLLRSAPSAWGEDPSESRIRDFHIGGSPSALLARIELALSRIRAEKAQALKMKLLEDQSITDYKTGLYNDRYIFRRLTEEFQRSERYRLALSIIMVDLDGFKELNDKQGHPFGDFVLQSFSRQLQSHIRKIDIPGRYGGDEFLVLLPSTGLDEAAVIANRMRASVENHTFEKDGHRSRITISQGINTYSGDGRISCDEFLKGADKAVLEAKNRGKNRVCLYALIKEK